MKSKKYPVLINELFAGLLSGIIIILIAIAFTALIFKGPLFNYFNLGISYVLLSTIIVNFCSLRFGTIPYAISRPEPAIGAVLSIMLMNIAQHHLNEATLLPTLLVATMVVTLLVGISMFLIGYFKLGQMAWFIPYPVTAGVIVGSAWIITQTSFQLLCPHALNLEYLLQPQNLIQLGIGIGIAVILFLSKRFWVLPLCMILFSLLINSYLSFAAISYAEAVQKGWLFKPFTPTFLLKPMHLSMIGQVDFSLVFSQFGYMISIIGITILLTLFNVNALETIEIKKEKSLDANIEQELRVAGIGNIISSLFFGYPTNLSLSGSLLNKNYGGLSRISGLTATLTCIFIILFYPSIISWLPIPVIAGFLFYIGLKMIIDKLWQGWHQLPLHDYFIILSIWLIIAVWSFLPGVLIGILITCLFFVVQYAKVDVIKFITSGKYYHSNVVRSTAKQEWLAKYGTSIRVFQLQGYLFFGSTKLLFDKINQLIKRKANRIHFIIFDFQLVNGFDSSAALTWVRLQQLTNPTQIQLIFTHCTPALTQQIKQQTNLRHPAILFFPTLDQGIEWCEEQLVEQMPADEVQSISILTQLMPEKSQHALFLPYLEKFEIKSGHYLIEQGAKNIDSLYLIETGDITISLATFNNKMRLEKGAGIVIGEIGFYLKLERSASVYAETDCYGYRLTQSKMKELEVSHPEIAMVVHKNISVILAKRLVQANYLLKVSGH